MPSYPKNPVSITIHLAPIPRSRCTPKWRQEAEVQIKKCWKSYCKLQSVKGLIIRFYVSHHRADLDNLYGSVANSLIGIVIKDDRVRNVPRIFMGYSYVPKGTERIEIVVFPPYVKNWRSLYLSEVDRLTL